VFSIFVVFISLLIGLFSAACVHNVNNKDPAIIQFLNVFLGDLLSLLTEEFT